ncbi:hypothetical protein G9A89_015523 [Geosiphon pyriformis]|nr:hypothetical protein G9A89_015523 [Geosiphon pyriformis]
MKKTTKVFGSIDGFRSVLSRKKKRGGILEDGSDSDIVGSKSSETGDTTESNSIDMKEECLVEETSFNYGKDSAIAGDPNQTPTGLKVKTKKTLGKSLGKIDFSLSNNEDDVLLDAPLELPLSLKNLVNISVCKFFILDIGLDKVIGKSSQEKLQVVKKLFSKINGFGGASTPLKFAGIIRAKETQIMVNSNLKKSSECSDWAVVLKEIPIGTSTEAVRTALSKFGIIKSIKMQLIELWQKAVVKFEQIKHADLIAVCWSILIRKDAVHVCDVYKALLYTLPIGTNTHDIWDYVASIDEKTCVIDCHSVSYAQTRCTTICFDFAELLDAVIETTLVLKETNLHWSCLVLAKYAGCKKLGHTLLACPIGEKMSVFSGASLQKTFSDSDKNRLAAIYAKNLVPIAHPVFFSGVLWVQIAGGSSFSSSPVWNVLLEAGSSLKMKPTPLVSSELNDRFAALKHSLASLTECVDMLAIRLNTSEPMADIVISESSGVATSGKTVVKTVVFNSTDISKLEETLNNLSITVMSSLAKMDNADSVSTPFFS